MWEALSASEPFYPGFTQAFDTIDQISPPTWNFKWIITKEYFYIFCLGIEVSTRAKLQTIIVM